jgi:2-dehydropantoate 2-reductase
VPDEVPDALARCRNPVGHAGDAGSRGARQAGGHDDVGATLNRFLTDPGRAAPVDWVLIATKTYAAAGTALWLARLVGRDTRVAVLQNGIEHVARFAPFVASDRIVPAVVEIPCERSAPGRVVQRRAGRLKVPGGAAGDAFAGLFDGPDLDVATTDDWVSVSWRKLAVNCAGAVSALLAAAGETVHRIGVVRG